MIKVTKVHNAQVRVENGNVSAVIFLDADKSITNINEGRYEVDGALKATFSSYAETNLSVDFHDKDGMVESLEAINSFLTEVRTTIKDIEVVF